MKKIMILILAVLAFSWTPVVSADQSPESVVQCMHGGGRFLVVAQSISEAINAEQCNPHSDSQTLYWCSACISSLENQGCKLVDVDVALLQENSRNQTVLTYLLSCVKP